jgi:fibronectin-binding autotransporter adhesin
LPDNEFCVILLSMPNRIPIGLWFGLSFAFCFCLVVHGTSVTWDGGSGTADSWSNGNNWNPDGDAPLDANLVMMGSARLTNSIDDSAGGLTFRYNSIEFAAGGSGAFLIGGGTYTNGANGITVNSGFAEQMTNTTTVLSGSQTWSAMSNNFSTTASISMGANVLTINGNSNTTFNGIISGTAAGGIIKNGTGTLTMSNALDNTFTGDFTINAGTVHIGAIGQGTNILTSKNIYIGDGLGGVGADVLEYNENGNHIVNSAFVNVNTSGMWNLNIRDELLGGINLTGGIITNTTLGSTVSRLTIVSPAVTGNVSSTTAQIVGQGEFNLGGSVVNFNIADGTAATDMLISMIMTNGGVIKSGAGTLKLIGNNFFTGAVTNLAGTLDISGGSSLTTTTSISVVGGTLLYNVGSTNTGAAFNLSGGTLQEAGDQNLSLGALSVTANSSIQLNQGGTGGSIRFANGTNTVGAGAMLTIYGWNYNSVTDSGSDDLIFFTSSSFETTTFLNNITFFGLGAGARILSTGELVPITPEPTTICVGAIVSCLCGSQIFRKKNYKHASV